MDADNRKRLEYGIVDDFPLARIDDIEIFGYTGRMLKYGYCDPSPFVRKVETFLELIGVYYKKYSSKEAKAPHKCIPYMNYKGTCITGSTAMINFLRRYECDLSPGIVYSVFQQSLVHMITNTIEQSFYYCCMHQLFFHKEQWNETKKALSKGTTAAYLFSPQFKKRTAKDILLAQGYGKLDSDQVIDKGIVDLQCVEDCLGLYGDGPYFLNEDPTIVDITIFSFLIPIFRMEHEWKLSRLFATINQLRFPKLHALCDAIYHRVCKLSVSNKKYVTEVVEERITTVVTKETEKRKISEGSSDISLAHSATNVMPIREVDMSPVVERRNVMPTREVDVSPVVERRNVMPTRQVDVSPVVERRNVMPIEREIVSQAKARRVEDQRVSPVETRYVEKKRVSPVEVSRATPVEVVTDTVRPPSPVPQRVVTKKYERREERRLSAADQDLPNVEVLREPRRVSPREVRRIEETVSPVEQRASVDLSPSEQKRVSVQKTLETRVSPDQRVSPQEVRRIRSRRLTPVKYETSDVNRESRYPVRDYERELRQKLSVSADDEEDEEEEDRESNGAGKDEWNVPIHIVGKEDLRNSVEQKESSSSVQETN